MLLDLGKDVVGIETEFRDRDHRTAAQHGQQCAEPQSRAVHLRTRRDTAGQIVRSLEATRELTELFDALGRGYSVQREAAEREPTTELTVVVHDALRHAGRT